VYCLNKKESVLNDLLHLKMRQLTVLAMWIFYLTKKLF